jgi:glycosyltransferase involved in cell wall biosynthesis
MIGSVLLYTRATPHHHPGGMETMSWSLATELARTVPDVRVVTTAIPAADGPFTEDGVTVVPLPDAPPGRYSAAWWSATRRHWRSLPSPPGAVLSVSAGAYAIVHDRAPHAAVPFVMQAHGTSWMEIVSKLRVPTPRSFAGAVRNVASLPRDLLRYGQFDRIVAVGEPVLASLSAAPQRWTARPDKVRLIPNGVRPEDTRFDPEARAKVRAELGIGDGVTAVGCVGRLHAQKGLDRAVRATAMLPDNFHLLLVGNGPDEPRLRTLTAELGVDRRVTFVGAVDRRDVRGYWSGCDVALLPTVRAEGLPMAALEALGCGLPTVVTAGNVGSAALGGVLHRVDSAHPTTLAAALAGTPLRHGRDSLLPEAFQLAHCARGYLEAFDDAAARRRA